MAVDVASDVMTGGVVSARTPNAAMIIDVEMLKYPRFRLSGSPEEQRGHVA